MVKGGICVFFSFSPLIAFPPRSMNKQLDLVKLLFEYGADIKADVDPEGDSVLHAAAMCGATDLCKVGGGAFPPPLRLPLCIPFLLY